MKILLFDILKKRGVGVVSSGHVYDGVSYFTILPTCLLFLFFSIFWANCATPKKELGPQDTKIDSKIHQLLGDGKKVNLLVLAPKEMSTTSCQFSEEIFEGIINQSNVQMESQFLAYFGNDPNFKLINRRDLSLILNEMKFQVSGLSDTQTSKLGKLSGADYLVLSSANLYCESGNRKLTNQGTSTLIKIEDGSSLAIDVLKVVLVYSDDKKTFVFEQGILNGNKIYQDMETEKYYKE
jgi:hypothetical protein